MSGFVESYVQQLKPESCASCGKERPSNRCGSCKVDRYCSTDCQKSHWSKHKKFCKKQKEERDFWIQDAESIENDGTQLFITASRLALGDCAVRDVRLAVELYQKAINTDNPVRGGHPVALALLAVHYEKGIGVAQDSKLAFDCYKRILNHPEPGEECLHPTFVALSRYYRDGVGGVQPSEEMATKYLAFSQSNPESREELQGLEDWWANGGREAVMGSD